MIRLAQFMDFWTVRRQKTDYGSREIDQMAKADGDMLRRLDPGTARQWPLVERAIAQHGQKKAVRRPGRPITWPRPAIAFAGSLALLIIAGLFVLNRASTMTYETARREESTITLGDSTEIKLNHSSELIVERRPFDDARRVGLKGEAFFRVRRNGAPFVVSTEIGTVRVLGTEFNVRVNDNHMEVAVLRGMVEVSAPHDEHVRSVKLEAGEMTLVSADGSLDPPSRLPYVEYPGWLHAKFHFQQTPFADACREIESRFDILITLKDPHLRNETVTGVLDGRSIESAVAALCTLAGKKYRYEDGAYTVY